MIIHEEPLSAYARSIISEASRHVERRVARNRTLSVKQLLLPLFLQVAHSDCLRADSLGYWTEGNTRHWLPRFVFQRTQIQKRRIRLGIFAGIHGDEPASILGLMDFVRELDENPELGRDFELFIYPLCNPSGYLAGTRESASGRDLNREFWKGSLEPEVALLEKDILERKFDGIIALHGDDTCDGFYGFARGSVLAEQLLAPALTAAEKAQPRDSRSVIDGFHAVNGIIHSCYDGILSAPPTQSPQPFEIILESPANCPLKDQQLGFSLALKSILTEYRKFISYAADL